MTLSKAATRGKRAMQVMSDFGQRLGLTEL
jgi:hypothetical protein